MNDTISQLSEQVTRFGVGGINFWFVCAVVELIVIAILLIKMKKPTKKKINSIKEEVKKEGPIDFGDVINNAFNAGAIYDDLKRKCHPDRFIEDPEKEAVANDLFQRITQNKHNISNLKKLKEEAVQKLGIK